MQCGEQLDSFINELINIYCRYNYGIFMLSRYNVDNYKLSNIDNY